MPGESNQKQAAKPADMRPVVHIVDDDASLRSALDSLLRSVGMETRLFASPQEFLAAKPEEAAGCLVLDIRLPGISGLDFQAQLQEAGIRLPVILMTGHGDIPMTALWVGARALPMPAARRAAPP
jgi:FixJ family two-component response regulator